MKYTFQYFLDLSTSADSMQVITVQAGGSYLMQRVRHLMPAYKYMKMGRVSIKLLPASTLPVDPLGLSYEDTDPQTVDPRDQMNPGLVRITNGEDIFTDVSSLSALQEYDVYNNMMLDPRWSKFMLQSGFRRSATPLYWQVGQLHQDSYPGSTTNYPLTDANASQILGSASMVAGPTKTENVSNSATDARGNWLAYNSDPRGFFQVGHRGRMGWIPTDALCQIGDIANGTPTVVPMPNAMPCINCITVILPKMHKTNYFYRLFVTETVYFSGVKNFGINSDADSTIEYVGLDNFYRPGIPVACDPYSPLLSKEYYQKRGNNAITIHEYDDLNVGEDE